MNESLDLYRTSVTRPNPVSARKAISIALTFICVLGWFAFLRPAALGGPLSFILVSGTSMEPTMHTGDLVITMKQNEYAEGDIVAFAVPEGELGAGNLVIHRVIGGSGAQGYVLQGDNRDQVDPWRPTDEAVVGKRLLLVPQAWRVIELLRTPLFIALFAAGFAVWVVLSGDDESAEHGAPNQAGAPA